MTDKLVEYMVELNTNPDALKKHDADPIKAAADFGLEDKDIELIKNQDVEEIKKRCESSSIDTKGTMIGFFKQ